MSRRALFVSGILAACLLVSSAALAQQVGRPGPDPLDNWLQQRGRPFIIGVAGDSGSGKSTFARGLTATLGKERVKTICVDDYHKLDRQGRKERGVTALNFAANDLSLLARHLKQLHRGRTIMKPIYDHSDGTLAKPEPFSPAPIIIVEGLHPFATKALRDQIDLAVYVDPSSHVKEGWKIKRDVQQRGHSREAVLKSIRERKPDYRTFVKPQRGLADMVVRFDWSQGKQEKLDVKVVNRQRPTAKRGSPRGGSRGGSRGGRLYSFKGGVDHSPYVQSLQRGITRLTGVHPQIEASSKSLDQARVMVATRVVREIAASAKQSRGSRPLSRLKYRARRR